MVAVDTASRHRLMYFAENGAIILFIVGGFQIVECGFKLIQYMAMGVPVVCSPVGVNAQLVRDGENGFWARNAEEWVEKLSQLLSDARLRERLGRKGRASIIPDYTIAANAPRLASVLEEVYEAS